jgi:hypothetical protein
MQMYFFDKETGPEIINPGNQFAHKVLTLAGIPNAGYTN